MTDTALSIQTSVHSGPYQCATNAVTGNRALLVSANAHADAGPHFASGAASAAAEHNFANGAISAMHRSGLGEGQASCRHGEGPCRRTEWGRYRLLQTASITRTKSA